MKRNTIRVNNRYFKNEIFNICGVCVEHTGKVRTLYDVYGRPSSRKVSIWNKIESVCAAFNGYNLTINSRNCMMFTCSFEFKHAGKKYCMHFTPSRWYQVYKIA